MKKIFKGFMFLIMCLAVFNPTVAKADKLQLNGDAYTKTVGVGSEFVYVIEVGNNSFNGTVTFDNNVLSVVKVETDFPKVSNDTWAGSKGTITHNTNGNQLAINYNKGDVPQDIIVTFKVNKYPSSGTTTVKVKANTNNWFGEPSSTMNVVKPSECPTCPTCEKEETECPVCEECKVTTETGNENANNDVKTTDNKDILLYGSLGACGFLTIIVVILAFRRK